MQVSGLPITSTAPAPPSYVYSSRVRPQGESWRYADFPTLGRKKSAFLSTKGVYDGEVNLRTLQRCGFGQYTYEHATYQYRGDWLDGKKHGEGCMGHGMRRYPDGSAYRGEFLKGERDGAGEARDADGTIYTGAWKLNRRSGYGSRYTGSFVRSLYEGFGRFESSETKVSVSPNISKLQPDEIMKTKRDAKQKDGGGKEDGEAGGLLPTDGDVLWVYEGAFKEGKREGGGRLVDRVTGLELWTMWKEGSPAAGVASSFGVDVPEQPVVETKGNAKGKKGDPAHLRKIPPSLLPLCCSPSPHRAGRERPEKNEGTEGTASTDLQTLPHKPGVCHKGPTPGETGRLVRFRLLVVQPGEGGSEEVVPWGDPQVEIPRWEVCARLRDSQLHFGIPSEPPEAAAPPAPEESTPAESGENGQNPAEGQSDKAQTTETNKDEDPLKTKRQTQVLEVADSEEGTFVSDTLAVARRISEFPLKRGESRVPAEALTLPPELPPGDCVLEISDLSGALITNLLESRPAPPPDTQEGTDGAQEGGEAEGQKTSENTPAEGSAEKEERQEKINDGKDLSRGLADNVFVPLAPIRIHLIVI
uniref:MORN repeat-containing protein n=1 Tax=Chromera velia CCMP2878 TaxID=1169474 RepID=A0A0G4HUV3_9ALVE|eukprot:Cvel_8732.t1-p1 / transcript=Cvel_8732.t1 / gene=Cvel_8732 / organism=Chromera_velia_CCMP2878 / gene_product=MORN repeat-containing protein 1, putative / transcript_product=MORN repeat-containing protein 1, putative / location=Cvel_scaffold488:43423-47828(-) / protein_length=586 / sequence_SO=supercontig / SO=protein_coding / is_pseudo=false